MNSLNLNGTWQLGWADGVRGNASLAERDRVHAARYLPAQVPGEVHWDLERAGVIDDVRLGLNALKARWVEEVRWVYRKEFDAPPDALTAPVVWLIFEGLDLTARIVLNGQEVGQHNNAFHPCRVNVAGKLRAGRNVLAVHLESGLFGVTDKPLGQFQYLSDHRLTKRHWLRKAGCQFGWDWAIRLLNVGIFKPVRLEWATVAAVEQLAVTAELTADFKRGTVRARLFVESVREAVGTLTLTVGTTTLTTEIAIKPGLHPYEATARVDNPALWWPAEHGGQHLHPVRVTLTVDGAVIGERTARVGFRRIRFNQEAHPQGGKYFVLEVNGRKVFAKGANWAPADIIFARCDRARYTRLLGLAREARFNFLRINGCGLYENDEFYDICDESGIMIWQDCPFSNIHYPFGDAQFLASVERETRWNIRRIESHPSLIGWCGNNEMEWLGGAAKTIGTDLDDITFFHQTLAGWMAEEDPARYYQPSSPFSPDGLEPNADQAGNQHPWSVGFKDTDFHQYRDFTCRFATEGGMLGAPALPTLRASLAPGQEFAWSFAWQQHDNAIAGTDHPSWQDQMLLDWLGQDVCSLSLTDYCYWAGLYQGEALREFVDNFRRRMFDSAAVAFWDFNDLWPVTRGWAIVDPYFRRAPAFYSVRRAYAPVSVVIACEGEEVIVFGVNDGDQACAARLRYGVFELRGHYPLDQTIDVTLPPNAATRLATFRKKHWAQPESSAAFATLTHDGKLISRNRLFLRRFKDLQWSPPQVNVRHEAGHAVFESSTFVWAVCLDLNGEELLADNLFDLYPGIPHSIDWPHRDPPRIWKVGNLWADAAPTTGATLVNEIISGKSGRHNAQESVKSNNKTGSHK